MDTLFRSHAGAEDRLEDLFALHHGGKALDVRIHRFLPHNGTDPDEVYQRKLNEAKTQYVNYFASCISYYCSYLFSHPMTFVPSQGEMPPYYQSLKEDCTGSGTDFHDLMRDAFRDALIGQRSAIVAQLPALDYTPQSLSEWEKLGAGNCTLRRVSPLDILDYSKDSTGNLDWITIRSKENVRPSPLSRDSMVRETIQVFDRRELKIFVFEYPNKPQPNLQPVSHEVITHGFGRVPVVLIDLQENSLGDKLEAPQVANLKARVKRAWLTNTHAHSLPIFFTDKDSISEAFSSGLGLNLDQGDSVDFMRPPAESLSALKEEIKDTSLELFRVAGLHFLGENSSSMPWRSGTSKQLDRDSAALTVRSYGAVIRETSENILNLIAEARGDSQRFSVGGLEHLESEDLQTLVGIASELPDIPSPTFKKTFHKRIVSQALKDLNEQQKAQIFGEIDESEEVSISPNIETKPTDD